MPKAEEHNAQVLSEAQAAVCIRCADLDCRDCMYRYNDTDPAKNGTFDEDGRLYANTAFCEVFDDKPAHVLLGEKCEEKVAEK